MAYQALYRTFRPSTLDGLVRQEHIVKILANQIETGRVGHAYLFCGPRGTGKTSTAKIFAKAINCLHPVNGSPCGKCEVCKALADPANLDISEIDAASNNGVNEMRDLREKVQYPPVSARFKVYIIDEVHMLSDSAFNALLKTLEEPPKHAVFILATTEPHKLPATILSRCMRFDFKLIPQEDIEEHLKKILQEIGKEYEDEAVSAIARAGAGSMRDSLSVADICISYSKGKLTYADVCEVLGSADFYEVAKLGESVLKEDVSAALSETEKVIASGKGVGVLAKDMLTFLNRCTIAKTCRNAQELLGLPAEMFAEVKRIADAVDGRKILRTSEIFAQVETDLRYSTSPRILFETAIAKACLPQADQDVLTLARRLDALEAKLRSGGFSAPQASPQGARMTEDSDSPFTESVPRRAARPRMAEEEPPAELFSAPRTSFADRKPEIAGNTNALENRKAAGALFMRSLRKNVKSGVLFTMCQDLETSFEGDTFVLTTDNEVIASRLNSTENHKSLQQALEAIGIHDFVVRQKGEKADPAKEQIEQLKRDFPDTDIEVK